MTETINSPAHYTRIPSVECRDVIQWMNFNIGSAVKYLWRAGIKTPDPIEDYRKAIRSIEMEIERIEQFGAWPGEGRLPGFGDFQLFVAHFGENIGRALNYLRIGWTNAVISPHCYRKAIQLIKAEIEKRGEATNNKLSDSTKALSIVEMIAELIRDDCALVVEPCAGPAVFRVVVLDEVSIGIAEGEDNDLYRAILEAYQVVMGEE